MLESISTSPPDVNYRKVSNHYLKRRQLRGNAGWLLLWSLGVGSVIGGEYYGWNYGLAAGGFWGLAIATFLMAAMYVCMLYCVAELSTAFPYAGGFYCFARQAFGPLTGFICGLTLAIEYILSPAAIVVGLGQYIQPLMPDVPVYLFWLVAYGIFVGINIWSLELTLRVNLWLTLVSILVLCIFCLSMVISGVFNPELLFNVPAEAGQSATWLPKGWPGVMAAVPYAIWFYLAIEQLPMAAEESRDVPRNMPKGLLSGIFTLIVLSVMVLIFNSGVGGGAAAIGTSEVPLALGFEAYFGKGSTSTVITTLALTCGLASSIHGITYAYGRILFALSRAGYLPRWISVTNKNHAPYRALLIGAAIGLVCAFFISISQGGTLGAVLLNMAVFAAVLSYLLVMASYIKLKLQHRELLRRYQSPLGIGGAAIGIVLAVVALFACFALPASRPGLWGVSILLVMGVLYFVFFRKNQLVAQAPEERVALIER